jgi:FemAB-related protein (PEP-CTERM system-associated)
MNAPFSGLRERLRTVDLRDPGEAARIERFVEELSGSVFHRPAWLLAVERGTRQRALGLVAEKGEALTGWLPLTQVHSAVFGRMLASSGFAVEGGVLAESEDTVVALCRGAEEWAQRLSCSTVELRGGMAPPDWLERSNSHSSFEAPLAGDDEAQLLAIPRKQRAEVRKGLASDLEVATGNKPEERAAHYAVYSASVRNLGTPVFPASLFEAVLDGLDSDLLTVRHEGLPVASVLSLYHRGAVMPYWGGGTAAARALRANDRMYFELMRHARMRGCTRFDFGRSKTGSGAFAFKRNWGFEPQPLTYFSWTAPGSRVRDADPRSERHSSRIALWKKLPLGLANRIGPLIARGLG